MKEPKPMQEIHEIREKMSKMSFVELEKSLEPIRKRYKKILVSS